MQFSVANQLVHELRSALYAYPEFVFHRHASLTEDQVPVFVYHSISPDWFEPQLQYLQANGYQTLSIDQFYQCIAGSKSVSRRSVLLTVDDARSSFWRFAFPLLKKYNMRATLFVIPGRTLEADKCRKNLEDVWSNRAKMEEIRELDSEDRTLCTWPELREMYASGLVSIESHTLFHREVYISEDPKSIVTAQTTFLPYNSPVTGYFCREDVGCELRLETYLGLPIFESVPLMSGRPFFEFSREALLQFQGLLRSLEANGDGLRVDRLKEPQVQQFIRDHANWYRERKSILRALEDDLALSSELIQQKIDPEAGHHLCFPYTMGSDLAVEAARKVGLRSCFWGTIPGHRINRPGDDPFYLVRIKNDFIWRLPGRQRKSILNIYAMKLRRRLHHDAGF